VTRSEALARLRAHRAELSAMGIAHAVIFGSTARDKANEKSDLDLAIKLHPDSRLGWEYFTLDQRVSALLGIKVDLVSEPANRPRLQAQIDRDRINAF
jgi:uncharacterized protein